MALLIALITITLVTISVMQFTHNRQVDYRRTAHWAQAHQAQLYADDSIPFAKLVLLFDRSRSSTDGYADIWAKFCLPDTPDVCASDLRICGMPPLEVYFGEGDEDLERASIAIQIEDMSARYNLNRLRRGQNREIEREVVRDLFVMSEVDPDAIGPIADWIDDDVELYRYGAGAEDPQYAETKPRYSPRNGELESLRELALIKGMSHADIVRLRPNIATLPSDESEAINVNTATRVVLRALRAVDPAMGDESLISAILAERCREPFADPTDLTERVPGFPSRLANDEDWIGFNSNHFQLLATARVDEVYQSIEALLHRTDDGIRVVYYLARRGAIIHGVDESQGAPPRELDFLGARRIGAF
jgi:type II secretory pathway component PulK